MNNELDRNSKFKGIGKEAAEKLKFSEALVEREKTEYEAHRALWNLAIKNVADTVRKSVAYPWASLFIEDARKWLSMQREGIDQRKNYPEKQAYDNFVRQLNQIFDRDDILIIDITLYNFFEAWFVRFVTKNDFIFLLDIPNITQIDAKNVFDLEMGKLKFGYLDKNCSRYVANSYNPVMFSDVLINIIESDCRHFSIIDDLDRLPAGWINPRAADKKSCLDICDKSTSEHQEVAGIEGDAEVDLKVRNCSDCQHYFYYVGEAGCNLDCTSYPELCEKFTPDTE